MNERYYVGKNKIGSKGKFLYFARKTFATIRMPKTKQKMTKKKAGAKQRAKATGSTQVITNLKFEASTIRLENQ